MSTKTKSEALGCGGQRVYPGRLEAYLRELWLGGRVKAGANGTGFKIMPGRASEFTLNIEGMRR